MKAIWVGLVSIAVSAAYAQQPADLRTSPRGSRESRPATATTVRTVEPQILARSAIVMDFETGKVLWSKAPDTLRYPASTTKILTTLLAIENLNPDDLLVAPPKVETVRGSSLYLKTGETITVNDALYAMMLRSANDVCHALAVQMSGSLGSFARIMNERAAEMGATRTRFTNPHGLPDKQHVTTARDLAMIARAAMRNERFREVARTQRRTIERSANTQDVVLINRNKWLFKDESADGIKTGFTNDAGQCYVGSATREGFRVITVILNSKDWQADHKALLDFAFQNYDVGVRATAGRPLAEMPVSGGREESVRVAPLADVQALQRQRNGSLRFLWASGMPPAAPIQEGQRLGEIEIRDPEGFVLRVPVKALDPVAPVSILNRNFGNTHPTWYILAGALLCGAWVMRRKTRTY